LIAWAMVVCVSSAFADKVYTVRRGDTLYGIAKANRIPMDRLAIRNGLNKNHHIYPGQRLVIPTRGSSPTVLPDSTQRAIQGAKVKVGRWKYIVIHHSAVDTGTVKGMDEYHRNVRNMQNGLAYHFVIGNGNGMGDGEIAATQRWLRQLDGGHLISDKQNKVSLGICLVGNFDKRKPSPKQMERLTALVKALMARCKLNPSAVKTHQQINVVNTRCPGRYFPLNNLMASLGVQ
jgi:murein DD-endopeptidase MepM/ murein hydrolase activator NlpD